MGAEERIEQLEAEIKSLKTEIRQTLVEIQKTLPEKPVRQPQWNRSAWVLALINLLMAAVLLVNTQLFGPVTEALALPPVVVTWLHALWLAIAFVWLLLQLYPLALLLTEEEREWRQVSWRNAMNVMRARPGLMMFLTVLVLVTVLINTFLPAAWILVTGALLFAVAGLALRSMLELRFKQS